jgi:hypothetical protein
MRRILLGSMAVMACVAFGCGKKGDGGPADRPHVNGTPHTDQVVGAWKSAGLAPESFSAIDPTSYRAGYCSQGRVSGVDALICEYADDDSLDRAKKQLQDGWNREGVHTAVAVRAKRTLLAVTDRAKADPSGKTINKLVGAFKPM